MEKFILIISAVFPPEPVVSARLSMDLYKALKEKGYKVKVIHPEPSRPYGFNPDQFDGNKDNEDEVITTSYICPASSLMGRLRESWSFGKACAKYIQLHSDEISCIYANTWPIFSQRFIVKTAKKINIPCLMHVQDIYPESLTNKLNHLQGVIAEAILLPIDKYILHNCTKVIAISEKMREYLIYSRNIPSKNIIVVTNWQDEKEFLDYKYEESPKTESPFTFMYMGNIGPVAGVDLLIEAFLKARLDNARLVIAGSGSMKAKLIEKASSSPNIEYWDVPNGKVPEIQSQADCMLLPIKKGAASSSIPSKLPAYMFSGKPIIGCVDSDSDTADAIKQADCGWIIEPENTQILAEKMATVASLGSVYLEEYGEKALKYGLKNFSKKENLNKLIEAILN